MGKQNVGFTLTRLEKEHQDLLWEMLHLAIHTPQGAPRPPLSAVYEPGLAHYAEAWGKTGDLGYIIWETATGTAIGAAWLRLLTGEQRGYGWVADDMPELSIAVKPDWRGQGLGVLLLQTLLLEAKKTWLGVSLTVSQGIRALHLYQRAGFEIVNQDEAGLTMQLIFQP